MRYLDARQEAQIELLAGAVHIIDGQLAGYWLCDCEQLPFHPRAVVGDECLADERRTQAFAEAIAIEQFQFAVASDRYELIGSQDLLCCGHGMGIACCYLVEAGVFSQLQARIEQHPRAGFAIGDIQYAIAQCNGSEITTLHMAGVQSISVPAQHDFGSDKYITQRMAVRVAQHVDHFRLVDIGNVIDCDGSRSTFSQQCQVRSAQTGCQDRRRAAALRQQQRSGAVTGGKQ